MCGRKEVARATARRVCAALTRRGLQESSAGRNVLAQADCATARAGNAGLWSPEETRGAKVSGDSGRERTVRALGAQAVQVHQVMAYGAVARASAISGRRAAGGESNRRAACHAPDQLSLRCALLVKQQVRTHPHRRARRASPNFRGACARSARTRSVRPAAARARAARRRTRTRCCRLAVDADRASAPAPASGRSSFCAETSRRAPAAACLRPSPLAPGSVAGRGHEVACQRRRSDAKQW